MYQMMSDIQNVSSFSKSMPNRTVQKLSHFLSFFLVSLVTYSIFNMKNISTTSVLAYIKVLTSRHEG